MRNFFMRKFYLLIYYDMHHLECKKYKNNKCVRQNLNNLSKVKKYFTREKLFYKKFLYKIYINHNKIIIIK